MERFFTSDLHLGHKRAAEFRGFDSVQEHDQAVMESLWSLPRRSKLWILGDIAFNDEGIKLLFTIPSMVKVAILGNHDKYPASQYCKIFNKVQGFVKYEKMFLSHCPIHPQELYRVRGNIHGHIHKGAATDPIEDPRYFNLNWDFHLGPVPWDVIDQAVPK